MRSKPRTGRARIERPWRHYRAAHAARHGQDRRADARRGRIARLPGAAPRPALGSPVELGQLPARLLHARRPGPDAWLTTTQTAFSVAFVERFDDELAKRRELSGADCLAILDEIERDAKVNVALDCTTPRLEAALADGPLCDTLPGGHGLVFAPGWCCEDCGGCCCGSCANASGVLSRLISWPKRRPGIVPRAAATTRCACASVCAAASSPARRLPSPAAIGTGYGLFPAADVAVDAQPTGPRLCPVRPRLDPQALSEWAADRGWQPPGPSKGGGGIGAARRACP